MKTKPRLLRIYALKPAAAVGFFYDLVGCSFIL